MTTDDAKKLIDLAAEKRSLAADTKAYILNTQLNGWHLGRRYSELKAKVPHGEWQRTLVEMGVAASTARSLMQIHSEFPNLGKTLESSVLPANSVDTARKVLALGNPELISKVDQNEKVTPEEIAKAREEARQEGIKEGRAEGEETRIGQIELFQREKKKTAKLRETVNKLTDDGTGMDAKVQHMAAENDSLRGQIAGLESKLEAVGQGHPMPEPKIVYKTDPALTADLEAERKQRADLQQRLDELEHQLKHKSAQLADQSVEIVRSARERLQSENTGEFLNLLLHSLGEAVRDLRAGVRVVEVNGAGVISLELATVLRTLAEQARLLLDKRQDAQALEHVPVEEKA